MYPLIEGLNPEETKKNLESAGASEEEIQQLLAFGEKAKDVINKVVLRQWEDDPEWASQILHSAFIELGIRKEEK